MKISLFNQRIIIEKNSVVIDKIGNHKNEWSEYFSCFAYVTSAGYKETEKESAGVTAQNESLTFCVRYCSELSKVNAVNFRIRFNDKLYNIYAVDFVNYGNKEIKLKATLLHRES